ncbi:two-component regulator propeller domain-containing protein [Spongiivirga sp. MCCC 1A20706]|uniref:sensor histidine kinase n=1 Tax=Spongiivirga sp. MCCC 1A20706 TaxID=3160963 RepID=UPI0039776EC5
MRFLLFFLVFTFSILGLGQQRIIHYTTVDGLPHNITYGIFQDSKGYIWIGTDNGLAKYDGREFKTLNTDDGLRSNYIIDIIEDDKTNQMILASWGGGLQFIKNDKVIHPNIQPNAFEKINNVQLFKKDIIVRHTRRNLLYRKHENNYERIILGVSLDDSLSILEHKHASIDRTNGKFTVVNNSLYFHYGRPIYNEKDYKFEGVYQVGDHGSLTPIFHFLKGRTINSISSLDNNLMVATQNRTIIVFNENEIVQSIELNIQQQEIVSVKRTKSGKLLVLAANIKGFKNAYLYDTETDQIEHLNKTVNTQSTISDVIQDHEGNIWITTYGDGVFCYQISEKQLDYFTKDHLPETMINDILHRNDTTFALTPNYLVKFHKKKVFSKTRLVGFGKSLSILDQKVVVNSVDHKKNVNNRAIIEKEAFFTKTLDSIGKIIYMDSIKMPDIERISPVPDGNIHDAIFYDQNIWIATTTGAYFFDSLNSSFISGTIKGEKLPSSQLKRFLKHGDSLWIATAKGLRLITEKGSSNFDVKTGLIHNDINYITYDHRDNLWIGTQNGVSVLKNNTFINITTETGLRSPYVQVIAESDDNMVWIGGDQGITVFNNNEEVKLSAPPILNIEQKSSAFVYDVVSLNRSKSLVFQYNLDGKQWSTASKSVGILDFGDLSRGKHTISFRAKKQDGLWTEEKVFSFIKRLPWNKDWRILSLISGAFVLVITSVAHKQVQKAKKRSQELKAIIDSKEILESELSNVRENVARDFHDDLGNRLARISIFSNLLTEGESRINDDDKELIDQISSDADYLFKGTKDFIFSLKSESDYLEEVVTYLSDFGEEYFRQFSIDFVVEKSIVTNVKLPYYWSKQLIFIFKEAMTNAVKHANADLVKLGFTYDKNMLTICCSDNGIGFDASNVRLNHGIDNMRQRASKIDGVLTINSKEDSGTAIIFTGKTTPNM